ncbi:MAG: hypothetical protein FJY37_05840 [Betaproteobacteria bacterium]|nr:hypothetical protein [Betaproteobacteria bacterium]
MGEIVVANFRHVANGLQAGQFDIGERKRVTSLKDLDPIYKQLLDDPVSMTLAVIGPDGRPSLTVMWFDYEGDMVLVNTASHRPKCEWIRKNPQMTCLLANPKNPYHWVSLKVTAVREVLETGPEGPRVTAQLNKIWNKYTGQGGAYGLRDPEIDEKRVLFECRVDKIATFGVP